MSMDRDGHIEGLTDMSHGGPGVDDDEGFFPQNRRNTHPNIETGLDMADDEAATEHGYAGWSE